MTRKKLPAGKIQRLAKELAVTEGTASKYVARGCPLDDFDAARKWRVENIRPTTAEGRGVSETARLRRAQADVLELEAGRKAGSLIYLEDHEEVVKEIFSTIAASLNSFGARHAPVLAGMNDIGEIRRYVDDELDKVRAAAARAVEDRAVDRSAALGGAPMPPSAEDAGPVG